MSDKKQLQDEETKKVDGGLFVFPGPSGFPSPVKVKNKLADQVEESAPDHQPASTNSATADLPI